VAADDGRGDLGGGRGGRLGGEDDDVDLGHGRRIDVDRQPGVDGAQRRGEVETVRP
jgi:hypothetical protein